MIKKIVTKGWFLSLVGIAILLAISTLTLLDVVTWVGFCVCFVLGGMFGGSKYWYNFKRLWLELGKEKEE